MKKFVGKGKIVFGGGILIFLLFLLGISYLVLRDDNLLSVMIVSFFIAILGFGSLLIGFLEFLFSQKNTYYFAVGIYLLLLGIIFSCIWYITGGDLTLIFTTDFGFKTSEEKIFFYSIPFILLFPVPFFFRKKDIGNITVEEVLEKEFK